MRFAAVLNSRLWFLLIVVLPVTVARAQSRMPKLAPGVLKTIPGFPEEEENRHGSTNLARACRCDGSLGSELHPQKSDA